MHATAGGRALLAHPSPNAAEEVNAAGLEGYGEHTITDADSLRAGLERISAAECAEP